MKNSSKPTDKSSDTSDNSPDQLTTYYSATTDNSGLADLQRSTSDALSQATQWGFSDSNLKVKRHKLDKNTWQLTVVNPKTSKTILQAEGHGDTVFAHEENLARMAETLIAQGLTIRTHFDD